MRISIILILGLICQLTMAHNMAEELKKDKIIEAVAHITEDVTHFDINITANPLKLDLDLQLARFDSGDKDIDKVVVSTVINGTDYQIDCDLLSGEYGDAKAIYFLIYRNCVLLNLNDFKAKDIKLSAQFWDDWKY